MASRTPSRLLVFAAAFAASVLSVGRRRKPLHPKRVLVAHHLLLGDTLMLTPLLAKLRERYPHAEIFMTTPKAILPLYEQRPYGVSALPYDPTDVSALLALFKNKGFDLAIIPGDNRLSWLALALGAKWIVAFKGDRPAYKNWPIDEFYSYPNFPQAWGDIVARLVPGNAPAVYDPADWSGPTYAPFSLPKEPYCVLHVGASSPLKFWDTGKWRQLANGLADRGFRVVWSGVSAEKNIVAAIDPEQRHLSYVGQLDLGQMWHLLHKASLLISPDTGIAHLGRIVNTPTITLFGPGSHILSGAGAFWRHSPYQAVTVQKFPCRDQKRIFKRDFSWIEICRRNTDKCADNKCMQAIDFETVIQFAEDMLSTEEVFAHPSKKFSIAASVA